MMTEISNRTTDLNIEKIKQMIEYPALYLANYFDDVKAQIDIEFVELRNNLNNKEAIEKNNNKWQNLIDLIDNCQAKCINNKVPFNLIEKTIEQLNKIESNQTIQMQDKNFEQNENKKTNIDENKEIEAIKNKLESFLLSSDSYLVFNKFGYKKVSMLVEEGFTQSEIEKLNDFDHIYEKFDDLNFNFIKLRYIKDKYISRKTKSFFHVISFSNETSIDLNLHIFNRDKQFFKLIPEYFKPFSRLEKLKLYDIFIESLNEDSFEHLFNLEKLEIVQSNFRYVSSHMFKNLTNLKYLTLEMDTFHEINLNYLVKLKYLRLINCGISDLKENTLNDLNELLEIYLKRLNLACIEPNCFKNLNNLKFLYIEKCNIKILNKDMLNGLNNLCRFYLDNRVNDKPQSISFGLDCFKPLRNLKILNLTGCNYTNVKEIFKSNNDLDALNISYNDSIIFENNCFLGSNNLTRLFFKSCAIRKINAETFVNLEGLLHLYLNDNPIVLEEGCFSNLKSLLILDLSSCRLKCLTKNMLAGLENLRELILTKNKITSFEIGLLDHMKCLKNANEIYLELNKKE